MSTRPFRPGGNTDAARLRQAFGRFATGVTLVTTRVENGRYEGLTVNSFSSVSLDPPLVLWSLRRASSALSAFEAAPDFAVNVLAAGQTDLARHFATPRQDRFEGIRFSEGLGGCPIFEGCAAVFECRRESMVDGGDHLVFVGRVLRARERPDEEPLVFAGGVFGTLAPFPARD